MFELGNVLAFWAFFGVETTFRKLSIWSSSSDFELFASFDGSQVLSSSESLRSSPESKEVQIVTLVVECICFLFKVPTFEDLLKYSNK